MTKEEIYAYPLLKAETEGQYRRLEELEASQSPTVGRELAAIEARLSENLEQMETIRNEIDSLSSPLEREILRLRYLESTAARSTPWKEVALKLYGRNNAAALRTAQRAHKAALEHLTDAM